MAVPLAMLDIEKRHDRFYNRAVQPFARSARVYGMWVKKDVRSAIGGDGRRRSKSIWKCSKAGNRSRGHLIIDTCVAPNSLAQH
jgi:hypothetical protein